MKIHVISHLILSLPILALTPHTADANLQSKTGNELVEKRFSIHTGSNNYPPLEFIDSSGIPTGYIVDIRKAIAQHHNESLEINLKDWNDALEEVKKSDLTDIALIPTLQRAKYYDFSPPFHYVAHAIFAPASSPKYQSIEQLDGLRIAVVQGAYASTRVDAYPVTAELIMSENELHCLQIVTEQKADVCVEGILSSNALIKSHNLDLTMSSPPFWPRAYVFAVRKGNTQLLERINNGLAAIVVNGTFTSIYEKWENQLEWKTPSLWEQIKILLWILAASLFLTVVTFFWSRTLQKKVEQRTRSLKIALEESRALRKKIEYSAKHDHLTNLLNREGFVTELDSLVTQDVNQNISKHVLIIQMRNLYSIIASLGYDSGVQTVITLSKRLKESEKAIVSHFGAGLFVLAIDNRLQLSSLIEKINAPLYDNHTSIEPDLIFSSVTFNQHYIKTYNLTSSEIIRRAMTALAYVREKKLFYLPYSPELEPDPLNLRLLNDFSKSGCSNFFLNFQPQIDLESENIECIEALIRWQHPELGFIPPDKFIPLFEESGSILSISKWVISEAVAFIKRNEDSLKGICVSINITNQDLADHSFIKYIKDASSQLPADKLILEITESQVIEDKEEVENAMRELRKIGILCAIDDYGTGYSSLSYLNNLSVEELKIDKSFIAGLSRNNRSIKIVASTIELAHELGLTVIAEGVETSSELAILQELGCDRVQGYLFSKPLKENDFFAYVNSFRSGLS